MALTDENGGNGMVMPVAPMYGGGNGGFGGFGDNGWWIILLFILLGNNGWGNGWGGFGNGGELYPWMNQSNQISDGFRDQMLNGSINGIQQTVTNGFNDVQMALCNGFAGVENGANNRQMANMQSMFNIQSSLQNCCCENRANIADLKYTVATENCADRQVVSDGVRDLLANQTANTQRILDQMCNDKIDAKNERIADLERQLTMANLAASQTAQTAQLLADNNRQTTALEQYLNPVPIPAYVVQNPNCCPQQGYCGCGA